jgi:hypothetical protein
MKELPIRKKCAQQKQPRPFDDGGFDDKRGHKHQEIQNEQDFGHGWLFCMKASAQVLMTSCRF